MCSIASWSGDVPTGLLSNLLLEMQCRGRDGTGIAFRDISATKSQTVSYRQAYSAASFVKMHQTELRRARQSKIGLCHTRRASAGMVIDPHNAHPFVCGKTFFIHNGFIRNWRSIDSTVSNDSIVLGPALEAFSDNPGKTLDVTKFVGNMAVAWMRRDVTRCFKVNQDLVSCNIIWEDKENASHSLCLVCSTREIVEAALKKLDVEVKYTFVELDEGVVYLLTPGGVEAEASLTVAAESYEDTVAGNQTKLSLPE
jgi:hypothetical protein